MDGSGRAEEVLRHLNVSRETAVRLTTFATIFEQWSRRINLVSRSSVAELWTRHILDSAQLMDHAPDASRHWLDLGSGAGFPGLVCAIMAAERRPSLRVSLVESDQRKCTFLRTAARETGTDVEIHASRIEALSPQETDIVSARALAPLTDLFRLTHPHITPEAVLLLPKGARHADEIADARTRWRFTVDARPSITDPSGRILVCRDLSPL